MEIPTGMGMDFYLVAALNMGYCEKGLRVDKGDYKTRQRVAILAGDLGWPGFDPHKYDFELSPVDLKAYNY